MRENKCPTNIIAAKQVKGFILDPGTTLFGRSDVAKFVGGPTQTCTVMRSSKWTGLSKSHGPRWPICNQDNLLGETRVLQSNLQGTL